MNFQKAKLEEYIKFGDTQPAIVVSISPLIVAAYSDEMDAVVALKFPKQFVREYNLELFSKLISVNVYSYGFTISEDIEIGPGYYRRYVNFTPTIVDFLSEIQKIDCHKINIPEKTWDYVKYLALKYPLNKFRKGYWFI